MRDTDWLVHLSLFRHLLASLLLAAIADHLDEQGEVVSLRREPPSQIGVFRRV